MRIALVYNEPAPSHYYAKGEELAVTSVMDSVKTVEESLIARGHTVDRLGLKPPWEQVVSTLQQMEADLVFNLFEGFEGRSETEWMVAKELEALGLPFTGASSQVLALCLDKAQAKECLLSRGVATARYQLLDSAGVGQFSMPFPVIVKPMKEDASHGLTSRSVVYDTQALAEQVAYVEQEYGKPVLVEQFLPGREFTVSIVGGRHPRIFPPSEMQYAPNMPGPPILSYAAKWSPKDPAYEATTLVCPAQLPQELVERINDVSLAGYQAVGSPAYARVDLRADAAGTLHILEINPNPDIWPEAGMGLQTKAVGVEYGELVQIIVDLALVEAVNPREERSTDERTAASHAA
jgi:D-alanine-D-alanine ligase